MALKDDLSTRKTEIMPMVPVSDDRGQYDRILQEKIKKQIRYIRSDLDTLADEIDGRETAVVPWGLTAQPFGIDGLKVKYNSATQIEIEWTQCYIEGTSTGELSATQLNRDTASDWDTGSVPSPLPTTDCVAVWAFTNDDGSSVDVRFSESFTDPTLPDGMTKKRVVSYTSYNGSSNIIEFYQEGNTYNYYSFASLYSYGSGGSYSIFPTVDLRQYLPPEITHSSTNLIYFAISANTSSYNKISRFYCGWYGYMNGGYRNQGYWGSSGWCYKTTQYTWYGMCTVRTRNRYVNLSVNHTALYYTGGYANFYFYSPYVVVLDI